MLLANSVMLVAGVMKSPVAPMKSDTHIVAWFHIPKCGTSFGTTLAHYANSSLPREAVMPTQEECTYPGQDPVVPPEECFTNRYPIPQYFNNLFWLKTTIWKDKRFVNWGAHYPIDAGVWETFRGSFFGMFRAPAARTFSSWKHFAVEADPKSYWERNRGVVTKMLTAQEGYANCCGDPHSFLDDDCCELEEEPDTRTALARLDGFKFVGLTEHWDLSICLFHAMFGGECLQGEFINMRPSDLRTLANPFENFTDPYDSAVYGKAEKWFWTNIVKFGVSRGTCARIFCKHVENIFDLKVGAKAKSNPSHEFDWPGRWVYDDEYDRDEADHRPLGK